MDFLKKKKKREKSTLVYIVCPWLYVSDVHENMHKAITVSDLDSVKWLLLYKVISSARTPACMGEPEGCALKLIHRAIYSMKHPQGCWGSQLICHFRVNVLKMACLMPYNLFPCTGHVGSRCKILTLQIPLTVFWYGNVCAINVLTIWLLDYWADSPISLKTWENFYVAT